MATTLNEKVAKAQRWASKLPERPNPYVDLRSCPTAWRNGILRWHGHAYRRLPFIGDLTIRHDPSAEHAAQYADRTITFRTAPTRKTFFHELGHHVDRSIPLNLWPWFAPGRYQRWYKKAAGLKGSWSQPTKSHRVNPRERFAEAVVAALTNGKGLIITPTKRELKLVRALLRG